MSRFDPDIVSLDTTDLSTLATYSSLWTHLRSRDLSTLDIVYLVTTIFRDELAG
jgi:hypothetical protein